MLRSHKAHSEKPEVRKGLILCSQNRLTRDGLRFLLDSDDMHTVGDARSLADAHAMLGATNENIRLVIYESSEGIFDSLEALRQITADFPEVAVVVLTDWTSRADLDAAIAAGVRGYLPRDISAGALRVSLELVLLGEPVVPMSGMPNGAFEATPRAPERHMELRTPLSEREGQILVHLEDGLSNKVIAPDLPMAEATVKVHVKAIMRKIGVGNRTQAAVWSRKRRNAGSGNALRL